jgi:wyosine [tRNA(Phe)-imidazoG37] synthetase (radical SAM superfamily)
MEIERRQYYPLEKVLADVGEKIDQCLHAGIDIDYLTLVPDGEPTLDVNLGSLIKGLKEYKIPVAVISKIGRAHV